jgi:hypothetical protein
MHTKFSFLYYNITVSLSIRKSLESVGQFVLRQSPLAVLFAGILYFILKTGIRGILPWASFDPVYQFPSLTPGYSSYSLGLLAIAHLFEAESEIRFFTLNLTILILFTFVFYMSLRKIVPSPKIATILFLVCLYSPVGVVLAGNIGRHDLLTIAGFALFFTSQKPRLKYFWLLVGVAGSPEHFIVGWTFAYITAIVVRDFSLKLLCRRALLVSISFSMPVFIYVYNQTESPDRLTNIIRETGLMKLAIRNFLFSFPLELYSYFGILIPILLYIFSQIYSRDKSRFKALIILFSLPILLNIMLVDKTRDYVIAMLASIIVLIKSEQKQGSLKILTHALKSNSNLPFFVGILIPILIFFPAIEVTFEGVPRSPHFWTYAKIIEFCSTNNWFC